MPCFNRCCRCGESIRCRAPASEYEAGLLTRDKFAVCNVCDPASSWRRARRPT